MIKKMYIGCFLFLMACACLAEGTVDNVYKLYVGQIKILKVGNIKRVAVGNSKVLSTSLLNNGQLLLIAESAGDSNVHIWFNNGAEKDLAVRVSTQFTTLSQAAKEVQALLQDVAGLKVRTVGDKIVLSGRVDMSNENAINTVKGAYPQIMDLTQKTDPKEYDALELPQNKMVYMNVKITEFNKNYIETLGINWDNPVSGPAAAIAFDPVNNDIFRITPATPSFGDLLPNSAGKPLGYFGIAMEISSRINFAVNSGNAVILAEPRLATRSGGEANFLAGGEIPLKVTNALGSSNVEFKEFGISMHIKPEVDKDNNIRANVSTEVSAVDNSVAIDGIPGFLTRKTSADVSMRSGETLVISGLINQQASKDISRLKYLSDIPILGELFKSKTFRDNKSELVIFVTPTVFDSESDLNKAELERRKNGVKQAVDAIHEKSLKILD